MACTVTVTIPVLCGGENRRPLVLLRLENSSGMKGKSEDTTHRDNVIVLFLKVYQSVINTVCFQKEYGAGFGSPK